MSNFALRMQNICLGGLTEPPTPNQYGGTTLEDRLRVAGGTPQQNRMIRDKKKSLDRALISSYQSAYIKKEHCKPIKALINPNKLNQDYDDKILSVNWEYNIKTGDIFEWLNTNSYWIVYNQELTELAYFRGDIRKCNYEIEWLDDGKLKKTRAAIRGPVETRIEYIQKHGVSVDVPNYSLNILVPNNEDTLKQFKRYSKFYVQQDETHICWRIEAVDSFSMKGIIEINAVEYYANETEDDIENGLVGGLIVEPIVPPADVEIVGETFIKPKKQYEYTFTGELESSWTVDDKVPVDIIESNGRTVMIKWTATTSGQFDLHYGDYTKTIVVESLF